MDLQRMRALSARSQALLCVAVLLDGMEAANYLEGDAVLGDSLSRSATELAALAPELRMPLVGSLMRSALHRMQREPQER